MEGTPLPRKTTTAGWSDPPPRGRLFQERLNGHPFWMLLACQLVNLANVTRVAVASITTRGQWLGVYLSLMHI